MILCVSMFLLSSYLLPRTVHKLLFFLLSVNQQYVQCSLNQSLISVHLNLCVPEQRVAAHDKMSITLCPPLLLYAKQIYKAVRVLYIPCWQSEFTYLSTVQWKILGLFLSSMYVKRTLWGEKSGWFWSLIHLERYLTELRHHRLLWMRSVST